MFGKGKKPPAQPDPAPESAPTNGELGLAEGPEGDHPMSFWEHIGELRGRLIRCALGVIFGFVLCFAFASELREFLAVPLHQGWADANLPDRPKLNALGMMDVFITDMRVAFAGGIFVAGPIVFWQVWAFVAPGLYSHEKRYAIPFVVASTIMFLLGATFCYTLVLPWTIQWLLSYGQASAGAETAINYQLTINTYIRDSTKILVAFGLVFEFPLLIAFLSAAGVVTHRTLLGIWKYAVVSIFIIGALLTPPEPVSQFMMAGPMIILFFASVGIAYLITKSKGDPTAKFEQGYEDEEAQDDEQAHRHHGHDGHDHHGQRR